MRFLIALIGLFAVTNTVSAQQIQSASLKATGLTCSMCSKAVYAAITALPEVETVQSNIQTSVYTIQFRKGSKPSAARLQKAVADAGFSIGELSLIARFDQTEVKNDSHITIDGQTFHFVKISSQTLNGPVKLTLLDKQFAGKKTHAAYASATSMPCYQTGVMKSCCPTAAAAPQKILYHVTL